MTRASKIGAESRPQQRHQKHVEDERGWAGQHGQRPANEEEKNYRTSRRGGRNRPQDQAGGPEHSGAAADEDRNP